MNGILDVALNLSGLYRFYAKRLEKEVVKGDRPNHIAIVLDGNRRWAKRNLVVQKQGHFRGADAVVTAKPATKGRINENELSSYSRIFVN